MVSVGSLGTVAAGSAPTSARASSSQSMAHAQPMAASPPPASVHPLSSAASMPPPPSQALWSTRLVDLLNLVRHEFDVIGNDAMHFKSQRVELEHRISQQINEVALMQEHVYELEKRHFEMVEQYEDEIKRLHALLEDRAVSSVGAREAPPHSTSPAGAPVDARSAYVMPPASQAYDREERERMLPAMSSVSGDAAWHPAKRTKTANGAPLVPSDALRLRPDDREPKRLAPSPTSSRERNEEEEASPPESMQEQLQSTPPESTSSASRKVPRAESGNATQEGAASAQSAKDGGEAEPSAPPAKKEDWSVMHNPSTKPMLDVGLVHTFTHNSVVCCVRFSPDGKYLATGCNRSAQIFTTDSGEKVCELQDPAVSGPGDLYIRSVCFSPDGKLLATGAEDRQIRIWDIAEQKITMLLTGHKQEIYSLEFSQDGQILASGSGDKTVRIWEVASGKELHVLHTSPGQNYGPGVTTVTLSPDGGLVAAGALDTFVRLWDTKTGKLRCRLKGHRDSIYSVCFMRDGQSLVSGSLDKTLKLWDLAPILQSADSPDDEVTNASLCKATFTGHKVRMNGYANSYRTMYFPSRVHQTVAGSRLDPRTVACSFGMQSGARRSSCSRATRIP